MYLISEIGQRVAWLVGKPVLFFLRFRTEGKENIASLKNGFILASNHTSELDSLVILSSFSLFSKRLAVYFVSGPRSFYRSNLWQKVVYTETLFRFIGAYPIIFGLKDYEKSLETHIKILRKGRNIGFFPEGGITKDGKLGEAKGGIVALSQITGLPIVPVAISGLYRMRFKDFLLRRNKAIVRFGKPIFPEELFSGYENPNVKDYKNIANEKIMGAIARIIEGQ